MTLPEILRTPGTHVWLFTRETTVKTIADAHRRLQSSLTQKANSNVSATAHGFIMTDVKDYSSEPALVVTVSHS
jgi:hypothetical protein